MICPFCNQGNAVKMLVKALNKQILICEECETVWVDNDGDEYCTNFTDYMKYHSLKPIWSELEMIE